jgi:CubicO group peptidase (beta-lactamase class C family)
MARGGDWSGWGAIALGLVALAACGTPRAAVPSAGLSAGSIVAAANDQPLPYQDARHHELSAGSIVAAAADGAPRTAALGQPPALVSPQSPRAADIVAIAQDAMAKYALKAVIVRVMVDGRGVVTEALGESMTGVPATTDMHFRNGAVAIAYMATLLLQLVDQGAVRLDDPLSIWLPDLPDADRVTLRMLANMTAGYPDYVTNARFSRDVYINPFRQWTPRELIAIGLSTPRPYVPGTNWNYSHTKYVILGQALERITGKPLATLMRDYILAPQGLNNTDGPSTAAIRAPVLHAFSSERREVLGIAPATRFYEETTYWNPSWTLAEGAIQTTNIFDMAASAVLVGEGTLLSAASHQAQIDPGLLGFGAPVEGCTTCHTLVQNFNYGLGVVLKGSWIIQNPLFFGYSGVMAYLPSQRIAIAVATTYGEQSFDEQGNYKYGNVSQEIFNAIGAYLAPDDPPPAN